MEDLCFSNGAKFPKMLIIAVEKRLHDHTESGVIECHSCKMMVAFSTLNRTCWSISTHRFLNPIAGKTEELNQRKQRARFARIRKLIKGKTHTDGTAGSAKSRLETLSPKHMMRRKFNDLCWQT